MPQKTKTVFTQRSSRTMKPIESMELVYLYTYICHTFMPNVGKYNIHGSCGDKNSFKSIYFSRMKVDIFLSHIIYLSLTTYRGAHMHPLSCTPVCPYCFHKDDDWRCGIGCSHLGSGNPVGDAQWTPNNPMGKMKVFIP